MKILKAIKVISTSLAAFAVLLSCKQASAYPPGSSYVLPPSAPSNWIVNPANPIYSPNPYNNSGSRDEYPSQGSQPIRGNSLTPQQERCASSSNFTGASQSFIDALNNNPSSANAQSLGEAMDNFAKCLGK